MKYVNRLKIISILFVGILAFMLIEQTVEAEGGVGVTGSFSTHEYKIVQGETIDTPLVNVIFVNNYSEDVRLKVYEDTPDGITLNLNDEIITVAANSRVDIPIVITAAEDAIPGEYDIYVKATLVQDVIQGKINIGSEYALKSKLTIYGEAADFNIDIVDVAGTPIKAVMNLYQLVDSVRTPLAYSDNGIMTERVVPGEYEVFAFWNDYQLVNHQFSLAINDQYQKTLVAETVQIYAYTVNPVFIENSNNELATANIRFILHNIYKQLNNARVVLLVYKDDELMEERDIFLFDTLEVNRHELGIHFVPSQGWSKSEYKFILEFYVDEQNDTGDIVKSTRYASSVPAILDVSGFTMKKLSDFFNERILLIFLLAVLLVGIFFLIRYILNRLHQSPVVDVVSPAVPKIKAIPQKSCPDCEGVGTILCPVCIGKGKTLYESIEEDCLYCDGIGEVMCGTCVNPKHLVVCPKCKGDKYIVSGEDKSDCTYCNGLGHVVERQFSLYTNGMKLKLGKKN